MGNHVRFMVCLYISKAYYILVVGSSLHIFGVDGYKKTNEKLIKSMFNYIFFYNRDFDEESFFIEKLKLSILSMTSFELYEPLRLFTEISRKYTTI